MDKPAGDTTLRAVQAWIGHAQHGETQGLRRAIFSAVHFQRERA